ncbi:heme-binding protein [Nocardioides ultimimeridianus]
MAINLTTRLTPIGPLNGAGPAHPTSPLGHLAALRGTWTGSGFNTIFRPFRNGQNVADDNVLELNLTNETLEFTDIGGTIPNRGFAQGDIDLFGLTYLQQVADQNQFDAQGRPAGIHIEPGIWITIPATDHPHAPATVARLATIPHGTSLLAQGTAQHKDGPPHIPVQEITPDFIGTDNEVPFPSQDISHHSNRRIPAQANPPGITQAMVDEPNTFLRAALVGKTIASHTRIEITTNATPQTVPHAGGGIADIAFLDANNPQQPSQHQGPNAKVTEMRAIFWISRFTDSHGAPGIMLQYSQFVNLRFGPLDWPHVSVANLFRPVHPHPAQAHFLSGPDAVDPTDPTAVGSAGPAGPAVSAVNDHFIVPDLRPGAVDASDLVEQTPPDGQPNG